MSKMTIRELAKQWEELFNLHTSDLYPGRYTEAKCLELAEQGLEIKRLIAEQEFLFRIDRQPWVVLWFLAPITAGLKTGEGLIRVVLL